MTMSKSVSDQNVEDMLSSVRRLVSNELPRNRRSRLPEGPGALVLTEEQRVAPRAPHSEPRGMSLEDRIAELEAAVDNQADDWEPDGSEDQKLNRPDRIVFRPSRPLTEEDHRRPLRLSEIALIETGPANEASEEDSVEEAGADNSEVSFRHEDPSPEDQGDDGVAETAAPDVTADDTEDAEPEPRFAEDPFADAVARDVAAVVAEMAEAALSRQADFDSALAEAVESARENPEEPDETPDEASAVVAVGEAPEVVASEGAPEDQAVESDAAAEPVSDTIPTGPAGTRPTSMSREDRARILNEGIELGPEFTKALRPLVSTMIREELQGELGERITRNVRKLVRQEVNRALSVRDLE